jgi:hypothetical protein
MLSKLGLPYIVEKSWNVNIKNEPAFSILSYELKVMTKRKARNQTRNLIPNH